MESSELMKLRELCYKVAYFRNNPIIKPQQIDRDKLKWDKMDEVWLDTIRSNRQFWFTEYEFRKSDFSID